MPRDLIQAVIGSSASAGRDFGKDSGMIVAIPSRGLMPYIIIPEGYYALVTTNGAEQSFSEGCKVWPSGFYSCAPWTRISHLVTKGNVLFDTPCKGCKTKDNVSVQIDVCVTFRIRGDQSRNEDPALVPIFVHEVTPSGLQQQLRDAIDESVRVLARSMKHTEVYGLRSITIMSDGTVVNADPEEGGGFENVMQNTTAQVAVSAVQDARSKIDPRRVVPVADSVNDNDNDGVGDEEERQLLEGTHIQSDVDAAGRAMVKGEWSTGRIMNSLNRQFMPQGVEIVDVMITDVQLPTDITSQMYSKTMVISENAQERMTQQFEMQDLKFTEALKKSAQTFKEERQQEYQDGQQLLNAETVRLNNLKAEASKSIDLLRQDNRILIDKIQAEAALETTKLEQERSQVVTELRTISQSKAAAVRADADLYCTQKTSEGQLSVERNDARGMETVSNAEGIVAPLLKQYNIHEQNLRKLGVFHALSKNKDIVIAPSGVTGDAQTLMLVDQILESSKGNGKSTYSRSEMLSELMLMRAGGNVAMNPSTGATFLGAGGGRN